MKLAAKAPGLATGDHRYRFCYADIVDSARFARHKKDCEDLKQTSFKASGKICNELDQSQMKDLSEFTEEELNKLPVSEYAKLLEKELQKEGKTKEEIKWIKETISDIEKGKITGTAGKSQENPWHWYDNTRWGYVIFYLIFMSSPLGGLVPTIPLLSDITPVIIEVKTEGVISSEWRIVTHRESNKINPLYCENSDGTYCYDTNFD